MARKVVLWSAALGLACYIVFSFMNNNGSSGRAGAMPGVFARMNKQSLVQQDDEAGQEKFQEWGRDPFKRLSGGNLVRMTGILVDRGKPRAIVNGQIVSEGDIIENYKIIRIKNDRIIINDGRKDSEVLMTK